MASFASIRFALRPPRRAANHHDLDWRRAVPVALFGALGLFVIILMATGYVQGGARAPLGVARQLSTGQLVEMDSRMLSGGRYQLVSVTPAGQAQGFRPGQVIDMTGWTLREKLAFAYPLPRHLSAGAALAAHQGLEDEALAEALNHHERGNFAKHGLDILIRLALLISSLCILQFAHGRPAFWAGLYLGCGAMADSPVTTFAGLPVSLQVAGLTIATLARPGAYAMRTAFAMTLFPGAPALKRATWAVFAIPLLCVVGLSAGQLATILFNAPLIPVSPLLLPVAQCLTQLSSLAIFAAAVWSASPERSFVLRIIFISTLVTLSSYIIQEIFLLAGAQPPGWMFWYFDTALLGVGIGYPWAIFARRIAGVDFIISRGIAYAVSVALIFAIVKLAEELLDTLADSHRANEWLIYGLPVAVALSMAWFQGRMTTLVIFLLDGDLRHLEQTLARLQAALPAAPDLPALARLVTGGVGRALHMESATLYTRNAAGDFESLSPPGQILPAQDPAVALIGDTQPVELEETGSRLATGLLFPLVTFGHLIGLLHCGARPHGKGYDRMERTLLRDLSREIAIALVWCDPRWRVPRPGPGR